LNLTVIAAPVVVTIDGAGKFARIIMAGNDPELGALLYLRIDELIDGESRSYTILVPESAAETGLDLADRESLEPVQEMAGYVLLSSIGVTVAPLMDNLVPVVHLPPGLGSLSLPAVIDGVLTVTVVSNWGLTPVGAAYYDSSGAVPEDAAIASLDANGALILTRPGG